MANIAILGSQNGDCGKGRIAHYFSPNFGWVIRFGGGGNAGHTIYRDGKKFVHHLLPSTDFRHSETKSYLGSGMVIDLEQLLTEVSEAEKDYLGIAKTIYVDREAFLVEPKHIAEDATPTHIKTTNRGIGPAYRDKMARVGHRVDDVCRAKYPDPGLMVRIHRLKDMGVNFVHLLEVQSEMEKSSLLFEGAQSVLLDLNQGIYPYVSCGDSTIAGIYSSGFMFAKLDKVFGVAKCYCTKVGGGFFPTITTGKEADDIRERGNEMGSTTGRPRDIGWLDLPALKYSCIKGGITNLIITKVDILAGMEKVPVCTAYNKEPICPADFESASPRYTDFPGWINPKDIRQLRPFIAEIEAHTGRYVNYISYGTGENDILKLGY